MPTKRIKSTHPESQGPFVVIDEADFDPEKHEEYVEGAEQAPASGADLTVVQLREALKAKAVEFPSTASKADLVALYDAARLAGA